MITTAHKLLTDEWTADVRLLETAIERFEEKHPLTADCRIVMFEVPRDRHLHVNVTHSHKTKSVAGWAGPGSVPGGFVNNRTFGAMLPGRIVRHIREMVFAEQA
jgi:hypothetical protein